MRHGKKHNHLGRKTAHRHAMLSNMACSLISHKRITTTLAKAKALRVYLEPLLTKSKTDSTHSRRIVFGYLQSKETVSELFRDIAPKIADRPGGYTRIIRTGYRLGDNAEMCLIELVDFNEIYTNEKSSKTTRRSRRGTGKGVTANTEVEGAEVETQDSTDSNVEKEPKAKKATEPKTEKKTETKADKAENDDLTKVEGIGPVIAETLVEAGITTFAQLAKLTSEEIDVKLEHVRGGHVTDTWPAQAKLAAEGKWDELKKWQDELDGGKPTE